MSQSHEGIPGRHCAFGFNRRIDVDRTCNLNPYDPIIPDLSIALMIHTLLSLFIIVLAVKYTSGSELLIDRYIHERFDLPRQVFDRPRR